MKKIVFLLALGLTFGFNAQAQKIGYINSQALMKLMPEAKAADSALQNYVKSMDDQYKIMAEEGQKKLQEYQDNQKTWTDAVRETKEKAISDLQNRMQEFQQNADDKIQKKRAEVYQPILDKAQKAIKAVGVEGGYDYILDGGALLYAKEGKDILPLVKAKLGIK
jgi:outer membrane protein